MQLCFKINKGQLKCHMNREGRIALVKCRMKSVKVSREYMATEVFKPSGQFRRTFSRVRKSRRLSVIAWKGPGGLRTGFEDVSQRCVNLKIRCISKQFLADSLSHTAISPRPFVNKK